MPKKKQTGTDPSPKNNPKNRKVDEHIGRMIRARRLNIGMSQEALGEHLGITFQQVQKYEKGTNRCSGSRLQQLSEIFDVSPAYFFDGAPSLNGSRASGGMDDCTSAFLASKDGQAVIRAWHECDPEVRGAVVDLLTRLSTGRRARAA